jgi:hypothetical protein
MGAKRRVFHWFGYFYRLIRYFVFLGPRDVPPSRGPISRSWLTVVDALTVTAVTSQYLLVSWREFEVNETRVAQNAQASSSLTLRCASRSFHFLVVARGEFIET